MTARVPGLQVFSGNGGDVGGEVALRLRSQTTSVLDPQPIVIVEGEQKADTLARWHLCATCNAEGAGKWTATRKK